MMNLLGSGRERSEWRGNYTVFDPACRYAAFYCTTVTWMLRGHRHIDCGSIVHIDSLHGCAFRANMLVGWLSQWLREQVTIYLS